MASFIIASTKRSESVASPSPKYASRLCAIKSAIPYAV